jgi:uncharacterized membrane protein YphA (DoxX/SURF4 family)
MFTSTYKRFEKIITQKIAAHSIPFLRIALGIIFFWFGILKFFPHLSSAENLATRTIENITFGNLSAKTSILILATWESLIGIGCIVGKFMRLTLFLLFFQMLGTIMPLFMFPELTFVVIPFVPTLEGQYIIKNLAIISSAMVLLATVRGGTIVADPQIAQQAREEEEEKIQKSK